MYIYTYLFICVHLLLQQFSDSGWQISYHGSVNPWFLFCNLYEKVLKNHACGGMFFLHALKFAHAARSVLGTMKHAAESISKNHGFHFFPRTQCAKKWPKSGTNPVCSLIFTVRFLHACHDPLMIHAEGKTDRDQWPMEFDERKNGIRCVVFHICSQVGMDIKWCMCLSSGPWHRCLVTSRETAGGRTGPGFYYHLQYGALGLFDEKVLQGCLSSAKNHHMVSHLYVPKPFSWMGRTILCW